VLVERGALEEEVLRLGPRQVEERFHSVLGASNARSRAGRRRRVRTRSRLRDGGWSRLNAPRAGPSRARRRDGSRHGQAGSGGRGRASPQRNRRASERPARTGRHDVDAAASGDAW
jgi:hypothetical protein